jgi:hypothetical protein
VDTSPPTFAYIRADFFHIHGTSGHLDLVDMMRVLERRYVGSFGMWSRRYCWQALPGQEIWNVRLLLRKFGISPASPRQEGQ